MDWEKKMFHGGSFLKLADDNKYIKNPEAQNRALRGFWENAFFVFLHYRGIGVFWPKIPLNLTSEGLKYPQEGVLILWSNETECSQSVYFSLPQKEVCINDTGVPKVSRDANDTLLSDQTCNKANLH